MLKELANEIIEILSESEAKDIRIAELETNISTLQVQSNLKLEEVKVIIEELKELLANA